MKKTRNVIVFVTLILSACNMATNDLQQNKEQKDIKNTVTSSTLTPNPSSGTNNNNNDLQINTEKSNIPNILGDFEVYSRSIDDINKNTYYRDDINIDEKGNGFLKNSDGFIQKIENYKFTDTKLKLPFSGLEYQPIVKINPDGKGIIIEKTPEHPAFTETSKPFRFKKTGFYYVIDNFKIVKKIENAPVFDDVLIDEKGNGIAYRISSADPNIFSRKIVDYNLSDIDNNEVSKMQPFSYTKRIFSNNSTALELMMYSDKANSRIIGVGDLKREVYDLTPLKFVMRKLDSTNANTNYVSATDPFEGSTTPLNFISFQNKQTLDNNGNGFVILKDKFLVPIENYQLKNSYISLISDFESMTGFLDISINKDGNGLILFTKTIHKIDSNGDDTFSIEYYLKKLINNKIDTKVYPIEETSIIKDFKLSTLSEKGDGILTFSDNKSTYARYIKNYELQ